MVVTCARNEMVVELIVYFLHSRIVVILPTHECQNYH
jgi:hypothetical protein